MTEVDLNHIYKKYDGNDKYSVNDFDLHIKDKEFIVFVGPSGCGKLTIQDWKNLNFPLTFLPCSPILISVEWLRGHSNRTNQVKRFEDWVIAKW